jgi:hypothetical protein
VGNALKVRELLEAGAEPDLQEVSLYPAMFDARSAHSRALRLNFGDFRSRSGTRRHSV